MEINNVGHQYCSANWGKNSIFPKGRKTKPLLSKGFVNCSMYGSRTRHSSVKGRRLNRLTNTPIFFWECKDKFMSGTFKISC